MQTQVAVSLGLADSDICLATLRRIQSRIGIAEIRLDLMASFDIRKLVAEAPCPLVLTCRPVREGGSFRGSEKERLKILSEAIAAGCSFVDVEWDSIASLRVPGSCKTKVICSRHWRATGPDNLWAEYERLSPHADVIKLVTRPARAADTIPLLDLMRRAETGIIPIGMGKFGSFTRVIAFFFGSVLLSYGALDTATATAPGQLTIADMTELYRLPAVGPCTPIHVHLCASNHSVEIVRNQNLDVAPGETVHLPLLIESQEEAGLLGSALAESLHSLQLTSDYCLSAA